MIRNPELSHGAVLLGAMMFSFAHGGDAIDIATANTPGEGWAEAAQLPRGHVPEYLRNLERAGCIERLPGGKSWNMRSREAMRDDPGSYTVLRLGPLTDRRVPLHARRVLAAVQSYAKMQERGPKWKAKVSVTTLACDIGCDRKTIVRALRCLVGYVEIVDRPGRPNKYLLNMKIPETPRVNPPDVQGFPRDALGKSLRCPPYIKGRKEIESNSEFTAGESDHDSFFNDDELSI